MSGVARTSEAPTSGQADPVVDVTDVTRDYLMSGSVVRALRGVSLTITAGESSSGTSSPAPGSKRTAILSPIVSTSVG